MKNIVRKILKGTVILSAAVVLASCAVPSGRGGAGGAGADGAYANGVGDSGSFGSLATREGLQSYRTVYFTYNDDQIYPWGLKPINASAGHDTSPQPTANKVVHAYAAYLLKHPEARVRLEGNTDARGSREYNIALGERRANSVANVLQMDGVPANQVSVISYGKEKPVALGTSEDAYSRNRRVDIVLQ